MKKGKFSLLLLSAAVLLGILLMAVHTLPAVERPAPIALQAGSERLDIWTSDGETWYAFLPGHIRFEDAVILGVQEAATVEGMPLPVSCGSLEPDRVYSLAWEENGQHQAALQILTGSDLPSLHIDTQSGSMDYIHAEKGNAERGSLRLYDEDGSLNFSGSLSSVRGRGNSTWEVHEKKPYSLELTEEGDLLGMGAAKKWVLLADALDASALRNRIVLDFAEAAGFAYTPECRWTELYLNGEYAGLYLLCEKVEVDPQRLDLPPDGSLFSMDRDIRVEADTLPYLVTENSQYLQVRYSTDLGALRSLIQNLENALLSEDPDQWKQLLDLDSWVKKYLVEEVFGSYDAGFQSQYYYCYSTAPESRIYAGPVWDYDSSLGNPDVWALNSPRGLFAWRPAAMAGYETPWLNRLYGKPEFRDALKKEYRRILPLLESLLTEAIPAYEAQLAGAFARNRIRWSVETEGLRAEAEHITAYLRERMEFLDQLWLEDAEFRIVRLQEHEGGGYYGYYAVEPGTVFADFPERNGGDFPGWYREDTAEPFDGAQPVTEDLCLCPGYPDRTQTPEKQEGLKDLILKLYHYVPLAVLVLMGAALVPAALWMSRGRKEERTGNRV